MGIFILTSMFNSGFGEDFSANLHRYITKRGLFAFVASDFHGHEKTDRYFDRFYKMFADIKIEFDSAVVVYDRMSPKKAQKIVAEAGAVWLAGGDTHTQFRHLAEYGLTQIINNHRGVVIGMSAGTLNLAKTVISTLSGGHEKQYIYPGIALSISLSTLIS